MNRINPFNWVDPSKHRYIYYVLVGVAGTIAAVALAALKKGSRYQVAAGFGLSVMTCAYGVYQLTRQGKKPGSSGNSTPKPQLTTPQSTGTPLDPPQSLAVIFTKLKEEIVKTKPFDEIAATQQKGTLPPPMQTSQITHAHEIFPHVFLGDYVAYLSIDPRFVKGFPNAMQNPISCTFDDPISQQQQQYYDSLDHAGYSDKNFKTVISVTRFDPKKSKEPYHNFQPNLGSIERIQILVNDGEWSWERIEEDLDRIFDKIDAALLNQTNILIHCTQGQTRSACVLCAYLINRCGVPLEDAFNFLKSKRHQVSFEQNPDIEAGLKKYAFSQQKKRRQ